MIIKWDRLKENAILEAMGNIPYVYEKLAPYALLMGIEDGKFGWRKQAENLRENAIKVIEKWDIRRVKTLIELFPSIIPKKFIGNVPECYISEKGDWVISFNS